MRAVMSRLVGPRGGEAEATAIPALLEAPARRGGPWLTFHRGREQVGFSRREIEVLSARWSAALEGAGVGSRDRVVLLLPNAVDLVAAFFGAQRLGAAPVPLPWPFFFDHVERHLDALTSLVQKADPAAVVTAPEIEAARRWGRPLVVAPADRRSETRVLDPDAPAFLQFTSGTTSRPKGAVITHRAALASARAMGRKLGFGPDDVGVSWLPLFHDMGLVGALLSSLVFDFPLHLMTPSEFMLHPRRWLEVITAVGASVTVAPNFAYENVTRRVKKLTGLNLSSLRLALDGSEPVHRSTIAAFEAHLAPTGLRAGAVLPVYGLAENTLGVAFADPSDDDDLRFDHRSIPSVGTPLEDTEIEIRGPDRRLLPAGIEGQIWVKSRCLMQGYFRDPEATRGALEDGWLATGDLGVVSGGRLFVTGREKELVIKAGMKFHPHEIEQVVLEALDGPPLGVAALSRARSGVGTEELTVVIETRDPPDPRLERTLRARVQAQLGVRTDRFCFVAPGALPRTTSGKVRRRACEALVEVTP